MGYPRALTKAGRGPINCPVVSLKSGRNDHHTTPMHHATKDNLCSSSTEKYNDDSSRQAAQLWSIQPRIILAHSKSTMSNTIFIKLYQNFSHIYPRARTHAPSSLPFNRDREAIDRMPMYAMPLPTAKVLKVNRLSKTDAAWVGINNTKCHIRDASPTLS